MWASAQPVLATTIDVDLLYTPLGGGIFQYELSVRNNGPNDVAIVSITDAPENDPLIFPTLEAPKGYGAIYDPGIGLGFGFVDLLEDTALFAANSTTSGFRFQSQSSPPANFTTFEALTIQGDSISGLIRLQAVPDAGSTLLLTTMGSLALVAFRRHLSLRA